MFALQQLSFHFFALVLQKTRTKNKETPIIEIKNLHLSFAQENKKFEALRGINLTINESEIVGVAGESGSGKTITALSILGLLESNAEITEGEILFKGNNLLSLSEPEMNKIRGAKISMIFQEPMSALNPVLTIGYQISEVLLTHTSLSKKESRERSIHLLDEVGISMAEHRYDSYPFELSGGMRQRAMIAMALAASPELLIADEPTTALDVTIQAQILDLIQKLSEKNKMAVLFITHDLGIVKMLTNRIAIMYAGEVIDTGNTAQVLKRQKHPYTRGLLNSLPSMAFHNGKRKPLEPIPGQVPQLSDIKEGCTFYSRCSFRKKNCLNDIKIKKISQQEYKCIL